MLMKRLAVAAEWKRLLNSQNDDLTHPHIFPAVDCTTITSASRLILIERIMFLTYINILFTKFKYETFDLNPIAHMQ